MGWNLTTGRAENLCLILPCGNPKHQGTLVPQKLFNGDGFCEVSGLVYVAAAADGDVVRQQLQGDDFEDGRSSSGLGDVDGVFDELGDLAVALDGDGDDAAGAGGDLLNIGQRFFVLQDAGWGRRGLGGDETTGRVSSMRALGPCFISPAG